MKIFFTLLVLILNVEFLKSQSIGYLDLPVAGELWIEFKDTVASNITISNSAAGQTWNYLNSFTVHDTIQYLHQQTSAAPANIANLYPQATLVTAGDIAGDYTFTKINFTGMYIDGVHSDNGFDVSGFTLNDLNYTTDLVYIPIPFEFGNGIQNTSTFSYVYPDPTVLPGALVKVTYSTFQDLEAESQGQLTTPLGTYNSVLRIREMITKTTLYEIDSFSLGNYTFFTEFNYPTTYAYKWLKNGPNCLVMTADLDEFSNVTSASYFTSSGLVDSKSTLGQNMSLFPNPVLQGNDLTLIGNTNNSSAIKIVDIRGRAIYDESLLKGDLNLKINTANLAPGLYFVQMLSNKEAVEVYKFSVTK
jgi:hypothetical protein